MRCGVDTGGTFTDVVMADGRITKVLSTPDDPGRAVREGLGELTPELLAHGTTVATNALLERRGAVVALVTTAGFADVIEIARQDRPSLYDIWADRPEPLVPRRLRLEVEGRLDAAGGVAAGAIAAARAASVARTGRRRVIGETSVFFAKGLLPPAHPRHGTDPNRGKPRTWKPQDQATTAAPGPTYRTPDLFFHYGSEPQKITPAHAGFVAKATHPYSRRARPKARRAHVAGSIAKPA